MTTQTTILIQRGVVDHGILPMLHLEGSGQDPSGKKGNNYSILFTFSKVTIDKIRAQNSSECADISPALSGLILI